MKEDLARLELDARSQVCVLANIGFSAAAAGTRRLTADLEAGEIAGDVSGGSGGRRN